MKKEKFFAVRQLAGQKRSVCLRKGTGWSAENLFFISAALVALGA